MLFPRSSARSLAFILFAASAFAAVDPALLATARQLNADKKYPEAQKAFEAVAAADPQCAEAHYQLSRLALRRNDLEASLPPAEKSVALEPDNAEFQHQLGDAAGSCAEKASIFRQLGLAKKCVAAYERAVALKPDNVDYQLSAFEFYRQAPSMVGGGTDKALATATKIKQLDPLRGRIAFATLYTSDKKYDLALAEFDEGLKTNADDYNCLYQVGKLAAVSGQFLDRGLAALRRCLELTPPARAPGYAAVHWRLGQILEQKKDPAAAKAAYEAALKADPNFAAAADALKKLK
jgi:tetratricopeptide (TPR) repeat protein